MSTEVRVRTWWTDAPGEKYWLEVTGRPDIGVNLKAPQRNEKGRPYWSYSLLRYMDQVPGFVPRLTKPSQAGEPAAGE